MPRLADKVAIVTGSSSGIGRAIALRYASEGAWLVCSDINERARSQSEQEQSTHEQIVKDGGKAIFVKCDVREEEEMKNLVKAAAAEFGRVDIMVNNAGILVEESKPIWEIDTSAFDLTLSINTRGVFFGTKHAAAQMVAQEPHSSGSKGWIINLASVYGLVGVSGAASYVASKHAVMGITKSAAMDCATEKIHVNAICPGWTRSAMTEKTLQGEGIQELFTGMHALGMGKPKDLAGAAVFLASDDAGWVTGTGLVVDGGYTAV